MGAINPLDPEKDARIKRALLLTMLAMAVLLPPICWYGPRIYSKHHQAALISEARALLDKSEYREAALRLHKVIGPHPNNLEASVLYARVADKANAHEAIGLWERVCDLRPDSFDYAYAWAIAALRFHDMPRARKAFALMTPASKNDARYHEIAGRIAMESGATANARSEFQEAIRLNPAEGQYVFDRAQLGMQSLDPAEREAARKDLDKVSTDPKLRLPVLRVLAAEAGIRGLRADGLAITQKLASDKEADFDDHLYYLSTLRAAANDEFRAYLAKLEDEASRDSQKVGVLVAWMNKQGLALVANDWIKRLAPDVASQPAAAIEIADAYLLFLDWKTLKAFTTGPVTWGGAEFQRLAFRARALRELGEQSASEEQWGMAVKLAEAQPARLLTLERKAQSWGWTNEANDVLWLVAGTSENPRSALNALARSYTASRDTHQLYKVWQRISELDPEQLVPEVNATLLSLLLRLNIERATASAEEMFSAHPADPRVVLTYSYAMYLRGQTEKGLQAMRALTAEQLSEPTVAAYYGILLADEGSADAATFLGIARKATLLPEEEKLLLTAGQPRGLQSAAPRINQLFHRPMVCNRFNNDEESVKPGKGARNESRQHVVQMLDLLKKIQ